MRPRARVSTTSLYPFFFAEAGPGTGRKGFSATLRQLASLLERGGREIPVKGGSGFDLWCDGGELSRGNVMVGLCTCSGHSILGPFSHLQYNQLGCSAVAIF